MRIRSRIIPFLSVLVLACLFAGGTFGGSSAHAAEQKRKPAPAKPKAALTAPAAPAPAYSLTPGFTVKPSEVALPTDVPIGQYLRIIRPFPNWTLICDENLQKKQKVCNVTQTIAGPDGGAVFSWSLAATQDGQPFFILRTQPGLGPTGAINLDPGDGGPAVSVTVKGCDPKVCIAYLQAGPRLRAAVEKKLTVQITCTGGSPPVTTAFRAPLDGLDAALAAI